MWASSKSPEIPTSANWVCSHKTFDKEKSPGRFYPIIMSWERYKKYYLGLENMGFGLDVSRVDFDDAYLASMEAPMKEAFASMVALEGGAIANPDENRMVGHYWLRAPELAPTPEIKAEIVENIDKIENFARKSTAAKYAAPTENLKISCA